MARVVAIGNQEFSEVINNNYFYVDKTRFIKEWWGNGDKVTLITRPRRFGKTLTMSMVEEFFSIEKHGSKLFEGLDIWKEAKYRELQGTYPVIFFSFANVKETNFTAAKKEICKVILRVCKTWKRLLDVNKFQKQDREILDEIILNDSDDSTIKSGLNQVSELLELYYNKKAIIILDEYDTPMQEAYVNGYWKELTDFMRGFFNSTFKTNPYLERAIMTGITRVSKESMFSDLNNIEVVTTTSKKYETVFGFTQEEVFQALEEYDLADQRQQVKGWYDGFAFGDCKHVYNPWSIIHFLDKKRFAPYWANTSSNTLAGDIIRKSSISVKEAMEDLLQGKSLKIRIDEEIVFNYLHTDQKAIWSLLLASGYLKIVESPVYYGRDKYVLAITNYEVSQMFGKMFTDWFDCKGSSCDMFSNALISDDIKRMNEDLADIVEDTFSFFDTGKKQAENFYHAFVLGLVENLRERYEITSNRESGRGRYDIMLAPKNDRDNAIIIEFKVFNSKKEKALEDTVNRALAQIEEKKYETTLLQRGIAPYRIKKYGFAFRGKEVLIGSAAEDR